MRRHAIVVCATVGFLVVPPVASMAHNHAANPSGFCNQSGKGFSPGNSGETNLNPGGKPVAKANAGANRSSCPSDPF